LRSRALSRLASSTQEDPITGQLQPNHPFTLRAVTTPHSLAPPSDALASLSLPTDAAGDAPVGASGNMPVNAPDVALVDTPGHALVHTPSAEPIPIPPSPAVFASTPVDSSSYLPVNAPGDTPAPPTLAALAPTPVDSSGNTPVDTPGGEPVHPPWLHLRLPHSCLLWVSLPSSVWLSSFTLLFTRSLQQSRLQRSRTVCLCCRALAHCIRPPGLVRLPKPLCILPLLSRPGPPHRSAGSSPSTSTPHSPLASCPSPQHWLTPTRFMPLVSCPSIPHWLTPACDMPLLSCPGPPRWSAGPRYPSMSTRALPLLSHPGPPHSLTPTRFTPLAPPPAHHVEPLRLLRRSPPTIRVRCWDLARGSLTLACHVGPLDLALHAADAHHLYSASRRGFVEGGMSP
jgi:hypothetical protein